MTELTAMWETDNPRLTAWHHIAKLWPQFLQLKTTTAQPTDGMPHSPSNPAERCILNLNIIVLEIEILDMIKRHCLAVRRRGSKANNLGQLLTEYYPLGAPEPERQAWEQHGSDFHEEILQALKLKPRPWTQHKLDLLAEHPERFSLTQAQTLIVCAGLGVPMKQQTLSARIKRGTLPANDHARINLADVLNEPVREYTTRP